MLARKVTQWMQRLTLVPVIGYFVGIGVLFAGVGPPSGNPGWREPRLTPPNANAPALHDIDTLDSLRRGFEKDRGKVRLMAVLSPT